MFFNSSRTRLNADEALHTESDKINREMNMRAIVRSILEQINDTHFNEVALKLRLVHFFISDAFKCLGFFFVILFPYGGFLCGSAAFLEFLGKSRIGLGQIINL